MFLPQDHDNTLFEVKISLSLRCAWANYMHQTKSLILTVQKIDWIFNAILI